VLTPERKAPWHLWLVAIVALLWNGAGAYTIMMAQAGRLYDLEPGEAAYYAAQPVWFVHRHCHHRADRHIRATLCRGDEATSGAEMSGGMRRSALARLRW